MQTSKVDFEVIGAKAWSMDGAVAQTFKKVCMYVCMYVCMQHGWCRGTDV